MEFNRILEKSSIQLIAIFIAFALAIVGKNLSTVIVNIDDFSTLMSEIINYFFKDYSTINPIKNLLIPSFLYLIAFLILGQTAISNISNIKHKEEKLHKVLFGLLAIAQIVMSVIFIFYAGKLLLYGILSIAALFFIAGFLVWIFSGNSSK